jgi:hypothetical protein
MILVISASRKVCPVLTSFLAKEAPPLKSYSAPTLAMHPMLCSVVNSTADHQMRMRDGVVTTRLSTSSFSVAVMLAPMKNGFW